MNTVTISMIVSAAFLVVLFWLDQRSYPDYQEPYTDHTEDWEKAIEALKK